MAEFTNVQEQLRYLRESMGHKEKKGWIDQETSQSSVVTTEQPILSISERFEESKHQSGTLHSARYEVQQPMKKN